MVGRNLPPVFGFNFTSCLTSHPNNQQLTTLSWIVQSKDCTTASRTHFVHAPLQQHGLRSYPLYSSDSKGSWGKTLVFPRLRQFSVPKLCCQMNFCKIMSFQYILLSKFFLKPCMFRHLLCLGTILALTCWASCQPSCSPPPLSESFKAASFHPFSYSTTAPTQFCTSAPAPSPSESGHETRWSLSAALRPAQQQMPCQAVAVDATPGSPRCRGRPLGLHQGGPATTNQVSFSDPLEVFARPWPVAPS